MVPWLVVAAMLALPLFFALFRSPEVIGPENSATAARIASEDRPAGGGAPHMDAREQTLSVTPQPETASVMSSPSGGVGEADAGLPSPDSAAPALVDSGETSEKPPLGKPGRPPGAATEALSETDVYEETPARSGPGKDDRSPATTAGAPRRQDSPRSEPRSGTSDKRWF